MVRRPQSPLIPPEAPDVRSSDESESNISPFPRATMVRPRVRGKPEKEETNENKDANDVLGSVKKPGSDMSQIWPNTIEENQNKKSKKDMR